MGLDKQRWTVFDRYVIRLLLETFGLSSANGGEEKGFAHFLGKRREKRESPLAAERKRYSREVGDQLAALTKKGLHIPVFTL